MTFIWSEHRGIQNAVGRNEGEEESDERRRKSEEREREDIKAERVCSIDRQLLSLVDAVTRSRRRHRPAPDASLTQPPSNPPPPSQPPALKRYKTSEIQFLVHRVIFTIQFQLIELQLSNP